MDVTPDQLVSATFSIVRKGFDPEQVQAFQHDAATALHEALQYASLMEQRAKAAVAKAAQHDQSGTGSTVTHGVDHTPHQPAVTSSTVVIRADDAEIISRTLVLAQRTAERTVAEATEEAAAVRAAAEADALRMRSDAELETARLLADARTEARRAGEAERAVVVNEINALLAKLDFLRDDVAAIENYAAAQRRRLVDAAEHMRALAENTSGPFAPGHSPALSSAADSLRAESAASVLSVVSAAAPIAAQGPVKVAAASASAPSAGSTATVPLTLSFSEHPTGEAAPIRPTSGPVSVPTIDDWDEDPSVRIRIVQPKGTTPSDQSS